MILFRRFRDVFAVLLAAALTGCLPTDSPQDEEREAHFQTGRARVNGMDYRGAIEAFQKALEVNPRSAAAHFELGCLYANKEPDPAAAIYHYERYLSLRPKAENAETIRQHIFGLKQDLAKAVLPLPSTPGVQRQLEQLMEDNRRLHEELLKWRAYYARQGGSPPTNAPAANPLVVQQPQPPAASQNPRPAQTEAPGRVAEPRMHKVQAGDTPSSIARKYNVKLEALLSANPGLNPKRMQVGQIVKVPAPERASPGT